MRKFDKEKFLKTELGISMVECVISWDRALEQMKKIPCGGTEYNREKSVSVCCNAQWGIYQMAVRQFYGIDYYFTRTNEYFGIVNADETDWLFKSYR